MSISGISSITAATDRSGLVLVASTSFTAQSTVSVDSCFSTAYDNYLIVCFGSSSAGAFVNYRMRVSGSDDSSSNYHQQTLGVNGATVTGARDASQTSGKLGYLATSGGAFTATLYRPGIAVATLVTSVPMHTPATPEMYDIRGSHNVATAYDGISLIASTGTLTGTARVYGLRNNV